MGSPFTSRQAGSGSGGKGCLDFFACLDLTTGSRTGFAEQARELAELAGVAVEGDAALCENNSVGQEMSTAARKCVRSTSNQNEWQRLIVLSLPEEGDFATVQELAVCNQLLMDYRRRD